MEIENINRIGNIELENQLRIWFKFNQSNDSKWSDNPVGKYIKDMVSWTGNWKKAAPTKEPIQLIPKEYELLNKRLMNFKLRKGNFPKQDYTYEDALKKFGLNPMCYISGLPLDYTIDNYVFDHIVPVSKGGSNELENMGICTYLANRIKYDMSIDKLVKICTTIIEHNK